VPDPVAEAQELLVDTVETLEKLEILRLLAISAPRTVASLMSDLALPLDVAREALHELSAKRIIREEKTTGWSIDPSGPRHAAVMALVQIYDQDRIGVLNRMTKISLERIRVSAARTFADAFVLRQKKKGDDE
jgi:hypothetical protein